MFFQFAFSCCKNIVTIATFENERINELRFSEARLFNFSCKFCCWTHGQKGVIHFGALKNITLHEEWFPERQMSVKLKFSKTSVHQPVVRLKNCCFQDLHRVGSPKIVSQIDDHLINTMSVRSPKTFLLLSLQQDFPVTEWLRHSHDTDKISSLLKGASKLSIVYGRPALQIRPCSWIRHCIFRWVDVSQVWLGSIFMI